MAPPGDTINFCLPANSTITLASAELLISKNLTIAGPGANLLRVERSTKSDTPAFRIFNIDSDSVIVNISGLTIANGRATGDFPANRAGGIRNGRFLNGGTLTITNVTISGNSADLGGGGIDNPSGTLIIASSTISGNSANSGGGINNGGTLTIANSTISDNSGDFGGGIDNGGNATIENSTISGNPSFSGGGIYNSGKTLTIINSTISDNSASDSGGGISNSNSGPVTAKNTIIALNTAPAAPDVRNAITSQGYNLIGNNAGSTGFTNGVNNDQVGGSPNPNLDPMLDQLRDNGGPTFTHALLSGSKAIDKGHASEAESDQRGFARPVDTLAIPNGAGNGSDIGAYEVQADQLPGCSTVVVTNDKDDGPGSLRFIIVGACVGSTITFAPNVTGAINLTSGELLLNKRVTINGPGANLLSVQRSPSAGDLRILKVSPASVIASISGLTIANGSAPADGTSSGGIVNHGRLTLTSCTVSGNTNNKTNGGGILNSSGTLRIINSTISGNSTSAGVAGGIYNFAGPLTIINSTITGNSATSPTSFGGFGAGGGIVNTNGGTVTLTNSTISGNTSEILGGGIRNTSDSTVRAKNTIIALNTSSTGPDFSGSMISDGFNLIGSTSGAMISPQTSDLKDASAAPANLGSLKNNGGPTQTHALLSGSVAIDKGNSTGFTSDQRGFTRPVGIANINGGDGSDIGAFEFGPPPATLANISTRLRVETGDNVLFGGFIITGTQPKKLIVRAIGPSTSVPGRLENPTLELYSGNTLLASNDNWMDSPEKQAIIDSTIPPANDLESAIVRSLAPGSYTTIVRGVNQGTGVGLVEIYDLDASVDSKLAQISTRGFVQTGDDAMFGGLYVVGGTSQKVIVRAIGPSLSLTGKLEDPTLELYDGNGTVLAANDNWRTGGQEAEIIATTVPPADNLESAIVRTFAPGPYTAIVRGVNNTTGIALVEVYALN